MKNLLCRTTALVSGSLLAASGAAAEEGITLSLGGYMNNYVAAGDPDSDGNDFNETGLFSDGEVWFVGETTLDNGITFGANIQLESFSAGDQIDENYGYVEGGFGKLQFGSENTAAYLMQFAAPNVGVPINTGWVTSFIPQPEDHNAAFRSPGLSTFIDPGNDENTLTYFTPRTFGFQLGLSYQPALSFSGDGRNFPVQSDTDSEYSDGVSVGLNFVESFRGVSLGLAGGWRYAQGPDTDITAINPRNTASTNGADRKVFTIDRPDMQQVSGGFRVGYLGVTLGGSIAAELDGRVVATTSSFDTTVFGAAAALGGALPSPFPAGTFNQGLGTYTSGANSTEGWSYDIGIAYSAGPWSVGLYHFHSEVEGSVTIGDNDEMDTALIAAAYSIGPGIRASLTGLWTDWDSEDGADNSGAVGVAGIKFGF